MLENYQEEDEDFAQLFKEILLAIGLPYNVRRSRFVIIRRVVRLVVIEFHYRM